MTTFDSNQLQEEKSIILQEIAASIAHELRTPLRTISLSATNLKNALPALIECYKMAQEANLEVPPIPKKILSSLGKSLHSIDSEINASFTYINMMLLNANNKGIDEHAKEVCKISKCINQALKRYPFAPDERKIITCNLSNDFEFFGSPLLFIHVLFNLIKNALEHLKNTPNPRIEITLEYGKSKNILRFRDNGEGIPRKIRRRIFERFVSNSKHGAGVGLAFCRSVMHSFHGEIRSSSEVNRYTEFVLYFPTNIQPKHFNKKWYSLIQQDINLLQSGPGI